MNTLLIMGWTPHEWEVARAFYCVDTVVDWSDTWIQQAARVQAHWNAHHLKHPGDDYILNRLRYQCRPMDFQWVAMLFSGDGVLKEIPVLKV